jgi:glycerophosphoryl diester phosphodiesterase
MGLDKGPIIVAHRGLHQKHVENSLGALKAGWEAGIEWCECDVHFSSDGVAVVIHDDTVDRTTSGTGFVANLNAKQLKKMGVATLDEVLAAMPAGSGLLVEYKPPDPTDHPGLLKLVEKLKLRKLIFQSFHLEQILGIARVAGKDLNCAMLSEDVADLTHLAAAELRRIHIRHDLLTPKVAQDLRAKDKLVGVWTPNEDADLRRMIELKVAMIITDRPREARGMVGSAQPTG